MTKTRREIHFATLLHDCLWERGWQDTVSVQRGGKVLFVENILRHCLVGLLPWRNAQPASDLL
jgi:hypothetical protein